MAATTVTNTTSSFLPLTTIFTPPASCLQHLERLPTEINGETTYFYYHLGYGTRLECMPSGWSPNSYFSPGRCPSGYTVATTALSITNDTKTETQANCCPTGYSYDTYGTITGRMGERCASTASRNAASTTNPTQINNGLIAANAVSVRWSAEDFSTGSTDLRSGHNSLSITAKAGIGIGVIFGVFIVIVFAFTIYYVWKIQKHQPGAGYTPVQLSSDEEKAKGSLSGSGASTVSHWSLWGTLGPDSWLYEAIAVCLSIACLVAIACVLLIYDGQISPELPGGIKLNTVVSVLATLSKSSLLFAVGECIGQLRWITLQQSRKPLSYIQLYDSASRGPWGSFRILLRDKFRSLVTVGACVVILALAFDPFIQQIISYPVRPTQRLSKDAVLTQSRFIVAESSNGTEVLNAINSGVWADPVPLDPSCPTGNCTWPHYRSVEICNQCTNVNTSRLVLAGWDFSSFNYSRLGNQSIPAKISMLDGQWSDFTIEIIWRKVGLYRANIPGDLYFLDGPNITYGSDPQVVAGIPNPLAVVTHAELNLPASWKSNDDLLRAIAVTKVTQCAFTVCSKTYNVSVTNGVASVETLDADMGSFYPPPHYNANHAFSQCWKPSSSPMTNWTTAGQAQGDYAMTDPVNYEFCGLDSARYIDSLPLSGTVSQVYELETFPDGSRIWQPLTMNLSPSSASVQKVYEMGLVTTMNKVASALSKLARTYSNNSIYGVAITQDSYVAVQWPWLTLPVVLLGAGMVLLVATALITSHDRTRLWKSSVLPLLFHGLEPILVTRNMVTERGPCEVGSEMERVAGELNVALEHSDEEGRTVLRGETLSAEPAVGELRRRRTF